LRRVAPRIPLRRSTGRVEPCATRVHGAWVYTRQRRMARRTRVATLDPAVPFATNNATAGAIARRARRSAPHAAFDRTSPRTKVERREVATVATVAMALPCHRNHRPLRLMAHKKM